MSAERSGLRTDNANTIYISKGLKRPLKVLGKGEGHGFQYLRMIDFLQYLFKGRFFKVDRPQ